MLNYKENNILNLFIKVYEMNLKNEIDINKENLNIIFDENHIPNKLIDIFLNKLGNDLSLVLYLSILYSLGFCNSKEHIKYINYTEYYKEKINNIIELDNDFKRICIYNAIKYLLNKKKNNVSILKEDEAFNKYQSLFKNINNLELIYTLKDLEKKILFKLLEKHKPIKIEDFIYILLDTNNLDNDIKDMSLGLINCDKDLKYLKIYIIRLILLDTYTVHYQIIKEKELELKNIHFIKEMLNKVTTPEFTYITECLKTNKFYLPKEKNLRDNIIRNYLYCLYHQDYELQCINKTEKEKKQELLKINPYYSLR